MMLPVLLARASVVPAEVEESDVGVRIFDVRPHAVAADIVAELHIIEAASHGGFHGAPEEQHIDREVRKFIRALWRRVSLERL